MRAASAWTCLSPGGRNLDSSPETRHLARPEALTATLRWSAANVNLQNIPVEELTGTLRYHGVVNLRADGLVVQPTWTANGIVGVLEIACSIVKAMA